MDKEALLLLATNLLNSPEGEKILGEIGADLDFDKIQKKLLREQSRLTREERRENRRERQEARRENREIKKRDRKRKILELKAQLKSNVPVLKEYKDIDLSDIAIILSLYELKTNLPELSIIWEPEYALTSFGFSEDIDGNEFIEEVRGIDWVEVR